MLIDAYKIAKQIIKSRGRGVIVTTQDPFEPGLIGVLLKWRYKTKLIVQEHGDVFGQSYWRCESTMNRLRYVVGLWVLQQADLIRVVSKRTKENFLRHGLCSVVTFPVAIDPQVFVSATPNPIVRDLFPKDSFVFLSVARFVPQKNLTLLLEAFAKVYQVSPQTRLLLVGSGLLEAKLKAAALKHFGSKQSPVVFLPWSDDVPGLMKAAQAYVLPSYYEGWGRVLIEAMLAELPVVTTDVGCAGEVLMSEKHGLIVPVADGAALTRAMLRLIEDESLYQEIKHTLVTLDQSTLPGTDLAGYGRAWAETLDV
jgi:glycosyltransferase involved in cell wall biosynthesis